MEDVDEEQTKIAPKNRKRTTTSWRITYCVFCSSLFNFGSVLMWGASRVLLPKAAEGLKAIFGLGSGLALLFIGWHLTEFLKKR